MKDYERSIFAAANEEIGGEYYHAPDSSVEAGTLNLCEFKISFVFQFPDSDDAIIAS